ncbi:MAG: hypothetical protein IPM27_08065 [Nitrosomonadales bacterium]|nr:hypothetical protein [Nitrosomonadales bacterium]
MIEQPALQQPRPVIVKQDGGSMERLIDPIQVFLAERAGSGFQAEGLSLPI